MLQTRAQWGKGEPSAGKNGRNAAPLVAKWHSKFVRK